MLAAAVAVAAGAGGFLTYRHFARPTDPRYQQFVRLLADDPAALVPDGRGRVALPPRFDGLTPHGEAFVVRRADGSFVVLFPTSYGNGTALVGLLYTSRPFRDGDTYFHQTTLGSGRQVIDVGNYHRVNLNDRVDEHWFHASYPT